MKILPLETVSISDPTTSRFQENAINYSNQLKDILFLKGNLLESLSLTTSAQKIAHKLGTTPLGYMIFSQNSNSVIYSTNKDQNFITLQASASVVVNIWVF